MKTVPGLVIVVVLLTTSASAQLQRDVSLDALTVPADRLTDECRVAPDKVRLKDDRIRGGVWTGLPITSNPWRGTDAGAAVAIRERIEAPSEIPDGPPLSQAQLAQFRMQLADNVDEAYAAVYAEGELDAIESPGLITVYAVRFKELRESYQSALRRPGGVRYTSGRTVVVLNGRPGQCFDGIEGHLRNLMPR